MAADLDSRSSALDYVSSVFDSVRRYIGDKGHNVEHEASRARTVAPKRPLEGEKYRIVPSCDGTPITDEILRAMTFRFILALVKDTTQENAERMRAWFANGVLSLVVLHCHLHVNDGFSFTNTKIVIPLTSGGMEHAPYMRIGTHASRSGLTRLVSHAWKIDGDHLVYDGWGHHVKVAF